MFATLDPKLRQLTLPSRRRVLLADTVGFLRNLPHALVTSFRATLEEVERAELLVHVRDAASPTLEEQKGQVEAVLAELEVRDTPTLQVLNKADLLPPDAAAAPHELLVSARTGAVAGIAGGHGCRADRRSAGGGGVSHSPVRGTHSGGVGTGRYALRAAVRRQSALPARGRAGVAAGKVSALPGSRCGARGGGEGGGAADIKQAA